MAEELQIAGTDATAKVRNPLGVVGLTLITLGIYYFVWYYKVNREMADLGRAKGTDELGDSPGTSLLAVTLGALIIVPAVISIYHTFQRTQAAARLTGVEPLNGWIALLLYLVIGIAFPAYLQSGLNRVWEAQAGRSTIAAGQQPAAAMPEAAQAPQETPPPATPPPTQ
jgi:uncharacterized protein DUF4234